MKYALVMRTLDRSPRQNYVGHTLRALARSGLWASDVPFTLTLVDSGSPDVESFLESDVFPAVPGGLERFEVAFAPRRLTNNENAARALRLGIATGADWIVHLEDDIDVCADFLGSVDRWLAKNARKDRHLYTFHTPYSEVEKLAKGGRATSWDYPVNAFYGNQAWAMRRADAESALAFAEKRIPTLKSSKAFDLMLKEWARETWPAVGYFLASVPSFAQHVGRESSLHFGRFHTNQSWRGPEWRYA